MKNRSYERGRRRTRLRREAEENMSQKRERKNRSQKRGRARTEMTKEAED